MTLQFKFDANQDYQLNALYSVTDLLDGLPRQATDSALGYEVISNLATYETLSEPWLQTNLQSVQDRNSIPRRNLFGDIDIDEGFVLEGVGNESHSCPHFTVEMETGTGKTYVYLRTMYELFAQYGFRKFIIVVPSIAIYEGVQKTFLVTASHFRQLYNGTQISLTPYDSGHLNKLHHYATSTLPECLVMTLDAFNKKSNNLYKPSEKLPGERKPYQYIQETRPIVILDEPQNMESERAKEAIRTLHPLFVLRYSATHRSSPNLVYRLTPFEAFRRGLVKRIEVDAVTEREDFNRPFLLLKSVSAPPTIKATLRTFTLQDGRTREADVVLGKGDDLFTKTRRDEHRGYVVDEIHAGDMFIQFQNGVRLQLDETLAPSRPEVFRSQIRRTLEKHLERQTELQARGIKVLSLFFIDRVVNYTGENGIVRQIFDEEFDRLKVHYPAFARHKASDVRSAYFAKRKAADGSEEAIDTGGTTLVERKAEKEAFELIMRNKEQLLQLEEPVSFIFAHSALKEGWDNPNVFQICTLNQTLSENKKRQEIGRGLRLCVNKDGERVFDEEVNILTVVANESYSSYVDNLQQEYISDGVSDLPPAPTKARTSDAHRNNNHFHSEVFHTFWKKLLKRTRYHVRIDSPALIQRCVERLNRQPFPAPMIVIESGKYIVTRYSLTLDSVSATQAKIVVAMQNTNNESATSVLSFKKGDDLAKRTGYAPLRGYKLMALETTPETHVVFSNEVVLKPGVAYEIESEAVGQRPSQRVRLTPEKPYPVFNLIERASRETGLTRPTINHIFRDLSARSKENVIKNPEGFANIFIGIVKETLADHIADHIEFEVVDDSEAYNLESLFPEVRRFPQKELIEAGTQGLYDMVQKDSDVEVRFVEERLKRDDQVLFFFKFPPAFKIGFPRLIGNYNPDWGIVRHSNDGRIKLELVRETKGSADVSRLQFPQEKRKIACAEKHFAALGIDYRHVTPEMLDWYLPKPPGTDRLLE